MRTLLLVVGLWAVVHAQTFKSTVDQVVVPVTVHGELNRPALDLRSEDFRVFDDGRQVPIVAFAKVREPVHIVLLLDTSRSMIESLAEIRSTADALIAQLATGDTIRVGTFSSSLHLSPSLTASDRDLVARLNVVPGANFTMLYDAIFEGCGSFTDDMHHRAVFLVSDGLDTGSFASPRSVIERAAATNAAIYVVGLSSRSVERGRRVLRAPDSTLRTLAEDSGGRYAYAGTGRDFSTLLKPMLEELRQQYLLAFTPAVSDGRLHSLVVTTRLPNAQVRARKSYLAPRP